MTKKTKEKTIEKVFTNADNIKSEHLKTDLNIMGEDFFRTAKAVYSGNDETLEIMLEHFLSSGMQTEQEINDAFAYVFCKEGGVGKLLRCYPNRTDDDRFYITEEKETELQDAVKAELPCITKGLAHFLIHYSIGMNQMEKKAKLNMLRA